MGVDVVDLDRFRRALERTPGLVARLFTPGEQAYAAARRDPTERLAVRFAAKEATMKALAVGLGAFAWRDVDVVRAPSGAPGLRLFGAAEELARSRGVSEWKVALSHSALVAVAVVVAS